MNSRTLALAILAALPLALPGVVSAQNVTELYVTPDTLRLQPGRKQGLTVQAFDDAGNVVLALKYRVLDSSVAQVTPNGTVSAGRAGSTDIVVQAGKKLKTVRIYVAEAVREVPLAARSGAQVPNEVGRLEPDPVTLSLLPTEVGRVGVRAFAKDGAPLPGARVHWRSLRTAVAIVEDSTGLITGLSTGQATIQALSAGGPLADVQVTVALATIGLDRPQVLLAPDESDTLHVIVPAQGGRRLRSSDLQWSIADDGVAEVQPDGVVRAVAAGRTELIVHGFMQELRIPVMVHQRVARFAAAPRLSEPVRLPVQATREFTLLPQTADSVPIDGVPITWSVGDTMIAAFDAETGVLTARRPGTTTLQFSTPGFLPKGWTIEVLPGTISLGRSRLALRPGDRTAFAPQFTDSLGRGLLPATGLTWVTSNAGAVRVSAEGRVEAVAPGRALITAQAPGGAPVQVTVFVSGDLLVSSTRAGKYGVYALAAGQPETFYPVVTDTAANAIDGAYSPDRTRVAYASDRFGTGNFDIFVADADGRNPVRLTTDPAMDLQPVWTPDGEQIVFNSGRAGARQLYVMRADGTGVRQLTAVPGGAEHPAISPDGRTVAYVGYPQGREGQSDIFVVPLAGGASQAVTDTRDARETRPQYLSTGELTWVLLRREKRGADALLRQPAAGASPTVLFTTDLALQDVALSPDGARMAWVGGRAGERNRDVTEFTFQWRTLASGAEISVRLLSGERITSPAF
jgi:acylphosphatase